MARFRSRRESVEDAECSELTESLVSGSDDGCLKGEVV